MLIRELRAEDYEIYCKLSNEFYASGASIAFVTPEDYANTFEACINPANPFLRGFVATLDDEIVGYFLLTYTWYNELLGMTVTLDEFYIRHEYQGRGFGSQIIRWIAKSHDDYKGILLEVKKDNDKAANLYLREGFEFMDYCQMILKPKEIYHKIPEKASN